MPPSTNNLIRTDIRNGSVSGYPEGFFGPGHPAKDIWGKNP
jgi:hypothetical protein